MESDTAVARNKKTKKGRNKEILTPRYQRAKNAITLHTRLSILNSATTVNI
jgi:hypothetical protein